MMMRFTLFLIYLLFLRSFSRCNGAKGYERAPSANHLRKAGKQLCTDLKKIVGMKNGAFITRDPAVWRHRNDGSKEYSVETCKLKRFTAEEAKICLAGKHMLLIGDSVSRYQFLSLAHFIEHGKWPARFGMSDNCQHVDISGPTCEAPNNPSLVMETDWAAKYGHAPEKSWKHYHMAIGGKFFRGRMDCQCARLNSTSSVANMRYQSPETTVGTGKSNDRPVQLTYMDYKGSIPIKGFIPSNCHKAANCTMSSDEWHKQRNLAKYNQVDYHLDIHLKEKADFHEKLEAIAPGVDIALFNRGLWGHMPMNVEEATGVFRNLFSLTKKNGGHCYWKGTTAGNNGAVAEKDMHPQGYYALETLIRKAAYVSGCGVYDLAHVTKDFTQYQWAGDIGRNKCCLEDEMGNVFTDAVHFQPWVYEEFNQILLNILC